MNNTIKSRSLIYRNNLQIIARFKGDKMFRGTMDQLHGWVRSNNVDAPLACFIDGERHGLYPVLVAQNNVLMAALSCLTGNRIGLNDGVTFATRSQLKDMVRRLAAAGIDTPPSAMQWMVTDVPFQSSVKDIRFLPTDDEIPF